MNEEYSELRAKEEYFGGATAIPAIPRDNFADMILEAAVCAAPLLNVGTLNFDVAAGKGGVVQVPMIAAKAAEGPITSDCRCLTSASSTITKATVTISSWGLYELICEFPLWKATPYVKDAIINEMGKALARRLDQAIWWSLCTAGAANVPGFHDASSVSCSSTATQGACCIYRYDLWTSIVSLTAAMKATGRNPDYIFMNPTVAAWFKMNYTNVKDPLVVMDNMGNIEFVNGLRLIETCSAPLCSTAGTGVQANPTMAIIIDSKRAFAQAWGKRPTYEEMRDPHCDDFQEVVWAYWGVQRVDNNAIAHIRNPRPAAGGGA
jgi:hypothetical protein